MAVFTVKVSDVGRRYKLIPVRPINLRFQFYGLWMVPAQMLFGAGNKSLFYAKHLRRLSPVKLKQNLVELTLYIDGLARHANWSEFERESEKILLNTVIAVI